MDRERPAGLSRRHIAGAISAVLLTGLVAAPGVVLSGSTRSAPRRPAGTPGQAHRAARAGARPATAVLPVAQPANLTGLAAPPAWAHGHRVHFLPAVHFTTDGHVESDAPANAPSATPRPQGATGAAPFYGSGPYGQTLLDWGGPVQHSPRLYLIFWGSNWSSSALKSQLTSLYQGFASSSWEQILTQYWDAGGYVGSNVTVAATYSDQSNPSNVTDASVQGEVASAIAANHWQNAADAQFIVLPAPGTTYSPNFTVDGGSGFCGYHDVDAAGSVYDFIPYEGDAPFASECSGYDPGQPASITSFVASHEFSEAATDPQLNAWFTAGGYEIGDICAQPDNVDTLSFGVVTKLWDDAQLQCSDSDTATYGPAQTPLVSFVTPTSGPVTGGSHVSIYGANFATGDTVWFGSTQAAIDSLDPSEIVATAPPGSGPSDVTVRSGAGTSATSVGDTYLAWGGPPTGTYASAVLATSGLEQYYQLAEPGGSRVYDTGEYPNGVNGTYTGSVTPNGGGGIPGDLPGSVTLDGKSGFASQNEGIQQNTSGFYTTTSRGFTVEGWTNLAAGAPQDNALFGKDDELEILVHPSGVSVSLTSADAGLDPEGPPAQLQASTPSNVGSWVQWAVTLSGDTLTVYRDGTSVASQTFALGAYVTVDGYMGALDSAPPSDPPGAGSDFLDGSIADVAMYVGALSQHTIAQHYALGAVPNITAVSPSGGLDAGGTTVTVTGTNLAGATAATLGAAGAATIQQDSATSITLSTPACAGGTFDIQITTPYGTSATSSADQFTCYPPAPAITGSSPLNPSPDPAPALSGVEAESGATVTVSSGTQVLCTAQASGGVWSCTPAAPLPDGSYTLTAVATDALGNASAASGQFVLLVAAAPPRVTITSPANNTTLAPAARFTYSVSDALTHHEQCSVDLGAFGPCPSSLAWLAPGAHTITLLSIDAAGNATLAQTHFTVSRPAVVLSALAQSGVVWREAAGTRFTFQLNEAATVRFAFTQRLTGRRVGGRCAPPTRANRSAAACTRVLAAGTVTVAGSAGANAIVFHGHLAHGRTLRPGVYRVVASATTSLARAAAPASLGFRIAP